MKNYGMLNRNQIEKYDKEKFLLIAPFEKKLTIDKAKKQAEIEWIKKEIGTVGYGITENGDLILFTKKRLRTMKRLRLIAELFTLHAKSYYECDYHMYKGG